MSSDPQPNKAAVAEFIDAVWRNGDVGRLAAFWTADCVNHADGGPSYRGLEALRRYHEQFGQAFAGFSEVAIDIVQQVAEQDRVVTHLATRARHDPSGKRVTLATIRIDRLANGKIAEHWSVADMAELARQIAG